MLSLSFFLSILIHKGRREVRRFSRFAFTVMVRIRAREAGLRLDLSGALKDLDYSAIIPESPRKVN